MLKRISFFLILLVFASLPVTGPWAVKLVSDRNETRGGLTLHQTPVRVFVGEITSSFRLRGIVVPSTTQLFRSKGSGRVDSLKVGLGEEVEKGEGLIDLSVVDSSRGRSIRQSEFAGFTGTVIATEVEEGDFVSGGQPLLLLESSAKVMEAQVQPSDLYLLDERPEKVVTKIDQGPPAFDCPFLNVRRTTPVDAQALQPPVYVLRCSIPREQRVFVGASGQLTVTTASVSGVLVAPRTAVDGVDGTGFVVRVAGRRRERVKVSIGLVSREWVEIKSGLAEGDFILDPVE